MNINYSVSRRLHKLERKINKGNLTQSKYLIIRRKTNHPGLGLFAYYITMLAWIDYALRNDMIPVIDMQNNPNMYLKKVYNERIYIFKDYRFNLMLI